MSERPPQLDSPSTGSLRMALGVFGYNPCSPTIYLVKDDFADIQQTLDMPLSVRARNHHCRNSVADHFR